MHIRSRWARVFEQPSFRQYLSENRQLLDRRDENGMGIIHYAIDTHVALDKIDSILSIQPNCVKMTLNGILPLHMMLDKHVSGDEAATMLVMLRTYPRAAFEYDDEGLRRGMPLHKLLQITPFHSRFTPLLDMLLHVNPQAVSVKVDGNLALHFALNTMKPNWITNRLLEMFPGSASVPSASGQLPLHIAVMSDVTDSSTITQILESYPAALVEPVTMRGRWKTVLEFAVQNRIKQDAIDILVQGGTGNSLKAVACARAAVAGLGNRAWKHVSAGVPEKLALDAEFEVYKVSRLNERRRRLRVSVSILGRRPYEVVQPCDDTVADLKRSIEETQGIPVDVQNIILGGRRLVDHQKLAHCLSNFIRRQDSSIKQQLPDNSMATVPTVTQSGPRCTLHVQLENLLLHDALRNGVSVDIIQTLVRVRPSFAKEQDGRSMLPLHVALQVDLASPETKVSIVRDLLRIYPESATIRSFGENGEYPLQTAIQTNSPEELVLDLVKQVRATDWSEDGFFRPAGRDDTDASDVQILFIAIAAGCSGTLISKLLDSRCPIHARNKSDGYSPLEYTLACNSSVSVFQIILDATQSNSFDFAKDRGPTGQTLMHVACEHRAFAARIKVLCDYAQDCLTYRDQEERLPLHVAVSSGMSFDAVRELLVRFPDAVYHRDCRGRTPLHIAIVSAPPEGVVFELAQQEGGIESYRNTHGQSLLQAAVFANAPVHVVQELLDTDPKLISEVSLIDGRWPQNPAGREVRRLAVSEARKLPIRTPMVKESDSKSQEAGKAIPQECDKAIPEKPDDDSWGAYLLGSWWSTPSADSKSWF